MGYRVSGLKIALEMAQEVVGDEKELLKNDVIAQHVDGKLYPLGTEGIKYFPLVRAVGKTCTEAEIQIDGVANVNIGDGQVFAAGDPVDVDPATGKAIVGTAVGNPTYLGTALETSDDKSSIAVLLNL